MVDPPWHFKTYSRDKVSSREARAKYDIMSIEEIIELPVATLAAENCLLMLWATWPMLKKQLEVLACWGFTYKSGGHWHKVTKHGKQAFGTGYLVRGASEPFLLGTIGAPKTANNVRNAFTGAVRDHSQKPEEAFTFAEDLMPNVRRCELFSRAPRRHWDVWGNDVYGNVGPIERAMLEEERDGIFRSGKETDLVVLAEGEGHR